MTKRCIDIPLSLTDLAAIESLYGEHETVLAQLTQNSRCTTLVSQLGEIYDYYHDLVSRHLKHSEEDSKVVYQQRRAATSSWSRRDLAALVSQTSILLTANGVVATNKLCFINFEGIDLVVHVLDALKLGCISGWANSGSSQTQISTFFLSPYRDLMRNF
ncbi:MAG: hypothetical protein ABW168_28625 [Sedimenticola sp.]